MKHALSFNVCPETQGHGKIQGVSMVGTHAGILLGEIAVAIEMGADALDIGKTIHTLAAIVRTKRVLPQCCRA